MCPDSSTHGETEADHWLSRLNSVLSVWRTWTSSRTQMPKLSVSATEKPERSERGEKQESQGCWHGQASLAAHCYPLSSALFTFTTKRPGRLPTTTSAYHHISSRDTQAGEPVQVDDMTKGSERIVNYIYYIKVVFKKEQTKGFSSEFNPTNLSSYCSLKV